MNSASSYKSLHALLQHFKFIDDVDGLLKNFQQAENLQESESKLEKLALIYRQSLHVIEKLLWQPYPSDKLISLYQSAFQELEAIIQQTGKDKRHHFIIVIPIADRPQHLQQVLGSLLKLCQYYQYGGIQEKRYSHIHVIVADDSEQNKNIEQQKKICNNFNESGLLTEYFGIEQQKAQLAKLTVEQSQSLGNIIGKYITRPAPEFFSHKGAAITRNIAYLKLNEIAKARSETNYLFYFIDSDQEFKIIIPDGNKHRHIYAINYFYHLDEIFSTTKASLLTGKVVGDPPVSPAVMANRFLDDVISFIGHAAAKAAETDCIFHKNIDNQVDDAAYHDMAALFGFDSKETEHEYHCTLSGKHTVSDCFNDFSCKLNNFFDGEHPTRVTYFNYENGENNLGLSDTIAARTVYTGNYIFKPVNLKYFISFATLKLRMAGPTLGRLIKSEIKEAFVSANLPMLHKRTLHQTGQSEFRAGVNHHKDHIDLSDEFERQFFGDVMLFSINRLTQSGYPEKNLELETIRQAINSTTVELHQQYADKHAEILKKLSKLTALLNSRKWWSDNSSYMHAVSEIQRFIDNIQHNFGESSDGYKLINSTANVNIRTKQIEAAIINYKKDRQTWQAIIS